MSAFANDGIDLVDMGYSCIPILPGEKRPGRYVGKKWVGMSGWQKYCSQLPTPFELGQWEEWPDAGLCVVLGEKSGIIGIDLDYGSDAVRKAVESILPPSPVSKKGAKGYVAFYKYNGEKPKKWFIAGESVCEILSHGNQTVLPPSVHPDGMQYKWITPDTLKDYAPGDLPSLPEDFAVQLNAALQPFMDDADKTRNERDIKWQDPDPDGVQTIWSEVNEAALSNLDSWVPKVFPQDKRRHDGSYRVVAHWRGVENANVSIHPTGIMDWGAGKGHTALDIVMLSTSCDIETALMELRGWLGMDVNDVLAGMPDVSFPANRVEPADKEPKRGSPVRSKANKQAVKQKAFENPPGVLGEICKWMEATAPRPQPILYVGAAIALLGAVMGRKYQTPSGLRTNIYCIGIAPSGAGKNHGINCVDRILTDAQLDDYLGGSKIGSGPGMVAAVARHPAILFQLDEFGMMMAHMADADRAPMHMRQILDNMTEFYSSANRRFRGIEYAGQDKERQEIEHPNMCIHGLSTPGSFFGSLSAANSLEGSLSRLLIFETNSIPYAATPQEATPPASVIAHLQQIHEVGEDQIRSMGNVATHQSAPAPMTVPITPDAQDFVTTKSRELVDRQREMTGSVSEPILTRVMENSLKLALIGAGAIDAITPAIDLTLIKWAFNIADRCADTITRNIDEHMGSNQTERDRKKIRRLIMAAEGLDKSDLVQKTRWLKRREREELLADMVEHGELVTAIVEGKTRPKTVYKAT
ncbi:MAG: bifunctional DNA primase/polymerase [Sneathiella sp.]